MVGREVFEVFPLQVMPANSLIHSPSGVKRVYMIALSVVEEMHATLSRDTCGMTKLYVPNYSHGYQH